MRPHSKKMVFLVFPRKKMVLGRKTNFLLGKNGFGVKNHFFPGEKMVLARKTNFCKTKKTHFLETMRPKFTKMVFFGFL